MNLSPYVYFHTGINGFLLLIAAVCFFPPLLAHFVFLQSGNSDPVWSPFVFSGTEASFIMCVRACVRAFKKFEMFSQAEHRVLIVV